MDKEVSILLTRDKVRVKNRNNNSNKDRRLRNRGRIRSGILEVDPEGDVNVDVPRGLVVYRVRAVVVKVAAILAKNRVV